MALLLNNVRDISLLFSRLGIPSFSNPLFWYCRGCYCRWSVSSPYFLGYGRQFRPLRASCLFSHLLYLAMKCCSRCCCHSASAPGPWPYFKSTWFTDMPVSMCLTICCTVNSAIIRVPPLLVPFSILLWFAVFESLYRLVLSSVPVLYGHGPPVNGDGIVDPVVIHCVHIKRCRHDFKRANCPWEKFRQRGAYTVQWGSILSAVSVNEDMVAGEKLQHRCVSPDKVVLVACLYPQTSCIHLLQ